MFFLDVRAHAFLWLWYQPARTARHLHRARDRNWEAVAAASARRSDDQQGADVRTIAGERMAETLDVLRCAVVLANERGTILHANRSAEHMLCDGGLIRKRSGHSASDSSISRI